MIAAALGALINLNVVVVGGIAGSAPLKSAIIACPSSFVRMLAASPRKSLAPLAFEERHVSTYPNAHTVAESLFMSAMKLSVN